MSVNYGKPTRSLDPVTKRENFIGVVMESSTRILRAARPGQILVDRSGVFVCVCVCVFMCVCVYMCVSPAPFLPLTPRLHSSARVHITNTLKKQLIEEIVVKNMGSHLLEGLAVPRQLYLLVPLVFVQRPTLSLDTATNDLGVCVCVCVCMMWYSGVMTGYPQVLCAHSHTHTHTHTHTHSQHD